MIRALLILCSVGVLFSCGSDDKEITPSIRDPKVVGVINDEVGGVPVVIYADAPKRLIVAYQRETTISNELLEFTHSDSGYPVILQDQHGNEYDIGGNLVNSDMEIALKPIDQVAGYWFFFPSFYKELHFHSGQTIANPNFGNNREDWLVNTDFIFSGSFRDGIPSIDEPKHVRLEGRALIENEFYSGLDEEELVVVVKSGEQNYIYPHRILEYHEVLNDNINGNPIVLSYCPLTGTSKVWSRNILNKEVEFGVSGLLYNNNLILYDRTSETLWSQILSLGINGEYISQETSDITLLEMSVSSVQSMKGVNNYLTTETGFNFDYSSSLYDSYKTDNRVSFPLSHQNDLLHPKERVLGIPFGENVKIYQFSDFKNN
ncbi:Protein of unknown function [Ekhidna lutea]|uniref:DUF3179 domain-containing protein n=1 Tax=Ekhidna lutea TaxID=447679 RepID=A0A239M6D7_EKHLU|nr:DUF3179 domain-containing (seleno)protein [Ekhidna lutea]SNT38295.1 Protein of unknown function [Ekhidna lutea]